MVEQFPPLYTKADLCLLLQGTSTLVEGGLSLGGFRNRLRGKLSTSTIFLNSLIVRSSLFRFLVFVVFNLYRPLPNTIMLFVWPPKFCISTVSSFSWDLQWSQEKIKTMLMQNLGGHAQTKSIMVFLKVACYITSTVDYR